MKIPEELYVNEGALELRMPLTPNDVKIGRQTRYILVNNTGTDSITLASFSISATENGYEIQRRFNLKGQKPVKIGHTILLDDAERAAYYQAGLLASRLPNRPIPFYDFSERDEMVLEEKQEQGETQ